MTTVIVNYGMGNLASVERAVAGINRDVRVIADPAELKAASRVILPGVGAFAKGIANLRDGGWVEAIRHAVLDEGKPLLGICLGMQMLASRSTEGGLNDGLGLVPGEVCHLRDLGCELRVPHVGWNDIHIEHPSPVLEAVPSGSDFYFVHSYAFVTGDPLHTVATVDYGVNVAAVVGQGNAWGAQFHPEKSSLAGKRVLQNFLALRAC